MNAKPRTSMAMIVLAMLIVFAASAPARASLAGKAAKELTEAIAEKFGREGAEELAKMGGKEAVQELLERAGREGGDALVARVTVLGRQHGPSALRVLNRSPRAFVAAIDGLPDDMIRPALRAVERDPQRMTHLVQAHGSRALMAEVKHPGVGASLVAKLGDDGLGIAERVSTDQAITLSRHADDIARLPAAEKASVLRAIGRSPARVAEFLERNPKFMITAASVATIIAISDEMLAPSEIIEYGPDGKPVRTTRLSPADVISRNTAWPLATVLLLVAIPLTAGVLLWLLVRIYWSWVRHRNHVMNEQAKLSSARAIPASRAITAHDPHDA